jgi:hypothetical protein
MVLKPVKIPSGSPYIVGQQYGVPHGIFQDYFIQK